MLLLAEQEATKAAKKSDSLTRLLADMKVKGGPPTTKKSALDTLLDPDEEEEEEDDDDDGEVIDKSKFAVWIGLVWFGLEGKEADMVIFFSVGSRTDYYDLPTSRRERGTPAPSQVEEDGSKWPAPAMK